jgi:hypothetical protein
MTAAREPTPNDEESNTAPNPAGEAAADPEPRHTVYTTIGSAVIEQAVFGIQTRDSERPNRSTGKISSNEIDNATAHFVAPDCYAGAEEALLKHRMVVLYGPTGTGKRTAALALLRGLPEQPRVALSPQLSLAELSNRRYQAAAYAIIDHSGELDSVQPDFDLGGIRDRLTEAGAFLIVTTTTTPRVKSDVCPMLQWSAPDPLRVVEAHLASPLAGSARASLRALLTDAAPSMRDLTELATRIRDGISFAEAVEHLDVTARNTVAGWFDDEPDRRRVAAVTTMAFARGSDVRTFETMLASFEHQLGEFIPEPPAMVEVSPEDKLRQTRRNWNSPDSLIVRDSRGPGGRYSGCNFRRPTYQQHVLALLWDRMDVAFWNAVRAWLGDVDISTLAHRLLIADGLTTLAEIAFGEVLDVLHRWSAGDRASDGQLVAVTVLSWMSCHDQLAPRALGLATAWVGAGDGAQQWVAATAFGGDLGVRYPHEAVRRLWTLCEQSYSAQPGTTRFIASLFTALVVESVDPGIVLSTLAGHAAARDGTMRTTTRRHIATATGSSILAADTASGRSSCALFLERFPDQTGEIARLLAHALHNRPTRLEAIKALRKILRDLGKHADQPQRIGFQLGRALEGHISADEADRVKAEIARVTTRLGDRTDGGAAATLAALLATLARTISEDRDDQ